MADSDTDRFKIAPSGGPPLSYGQQMVPSAFVPPRLSAPPPPPPPASGNTPSGRIIAYIYRAPDGTETVFDPSEIFILREGTDG